MPGLFEVLEQARGFGFLGPGPVSGHVDHADGFVRAWGGPPPRQVVDLGSGGGVPGLVLALRWPASSIVLLDASERRTAFLAEAVESLALGRGRVVVRRLRAEDAGRDASLRGRADLVTARGFGPPAVTAECAAPLLSIGGRLVVSEPPAAPSRWPYEGVRQLGLVPLRVVQAPATYVVLSLCDPCPDRFPRRVGIPAKRPLF